MKYIVHELFVIRVMEIGGGGAGGTCDTWCTPSLLKHFLSLLYQQEQEEEIR